MDWCLCLCVVSMDYMELQEIRRVLRNHEESIQCNRISLFSVSTTVHENEHQAISQFASILGTLVQQKQPIATLEAECSMLQNMVVNLSKGTQSGPSNQRMSINLAQEDFKEEDAIHQLIEDMKKKLSKDMCKLSFLLIGSCQFCLKTLDSSNMQFRCLA